VGVEMVKIQTRTIRKKNKAGKPPYVYKQHLIPVPLTRNEELKPFLKKQLEFGMNVKDDNLDVSLKKQEDLADKYEKT
jgi:hypothetical protein